MLYNEYLTEKKDYQEVGHLLLLEKKHACLFYKPGKGKTYPTIDAMRDVDEQFSGSARVLVLSTADAIKNMWEAEMAPQNILPLNTVMMSFTSAIQDATKIKLMSIKWDIIVIDECHKIKSHNSKISKLVYSLSKKAKYVWGLTGTPRGNNDVDIYCQFHNMCISEWGDINYTTFVNLCCDVEKKFFRGNCITTPIGINAKYKAGWERNIAEYTQIVGYSEEDNMPECNVEEVNLPFNETKEYRNLVEGVIQLSDYETTMTKLVAITKMHQCANGYLYLDDEEGNKRKTYTICKNEKLNWLKNNLTKNTLIVYRFAQDLEDISKCLDEMNITYTEIVEDFKQKKADILLLQCSRCESFNLQNCNDCIFYTLDYSYIKYNQMLHRLWRMGQTKPVNIKILIFKGSIESDIWNAVKNKEKFAELFMSVKRGLM